MLYKRIGIASIDIARRAPVLSAYAQKGTEDDSPGTNSVQAAVSAARTALTAGASAVSTCDVLLRSRSVKMEVIQARRHAPNTLETAASDMPPSKDDYDFHDQIGHLLRRAYQRHVAIFQEAIPDSQLTAAQFVALSAVKESKGCSLNDIVKTTAIDQATIRGVVDRLKARKLVEVAPDPTDGRKLVVKPTPQGEALIDATVPFATRVTERTYGALNPGERVALQYLLRKMLELDES
jgi:MarR family transcriptional regulator, lower aerobic nicotinate degradation pathway regulator